MPLVKLVAAWTLIVIALNVRARKAATTSCAAGAVRAAGDFVSAAAVIMFADAAMSLDNVVALAAIAGGNFWLLALGVLLSIPIIAYGSLILSRIIRRAPEILTLGAVVLGWIAGEMAVSDPLVAGWVQSNAPALARLRARSRRRFRLARRRGRARTTLAAPRDRAGARPAGTRPAAACGCCTAPTGAGSHASRQRRPRPRRRRSKTGLRPAVADGL